MNKADARIVEKADELNLPPEAVTAAFEASDAALNGKWEAHTGEDYTVVMLPDEVTDTASIRIYGEHAEAIAVRVSHVPEMLAALQDVTAALDNTLLHHSKNMTAADVKGRTAVLLTAQTLLHDLGYGDEAEDEGSATVDAETN